MQMPLDEISLWLLDLADSLPDFDFRIMEFYAPTDSHFDPLRAYFVVAEFFDDQVDFAIERLAETGEIPPIEEPAQGLLRLRLSFASEFCCSVASANTCKVLTVSLGPLSRGDLVKWLLGPLWDNDGFDTIVKNFEIRHASRLPGNLRN